MTDLFDQQITDGLHRAVDGFSVPRGSFGDVRRRVRARRSRHVAAAVLPTLAGLVWIGTRSAGDPNPLAAGAATESTTGSSETAPDTAVTSSTEPTTSSIGGSAITPELVAGVLCIDATGQADSSRNECTGYLPDARRMKAPSAIVINDTPTFVVPLDGTFLADAQTLTDQFGVPVRSDLLAHLLENLGDTDLTGVRVLMVIGTTDATVCTVPGCNVPVTTETTVIGDPTIALADQVARSGALFEALGFPAGEIVAQGDDKVQLRALDPSRPDEHFVTLTIGRQAADGATVTTLSIATSDGATVATRQNAAGWLYELEVTDYKPVSTLPTGDQLIQLLISFFG